MGIFDNFINRKKTCVIAEKFSVASEYAKALNCKNGENCFEGKKYVIIWTDGHICTLYSPEDYDMKYKKWSLDDLPIDPNGMWIKARKGKEFKFRLIKNILERDDIDRVCIATDSAREGNLIAEYVLRLAENKKPVYRAMIATTGEKREILDGFKKMKKNNEYKNMTEAAETRDMIDWLIGCNFSRAYSLINNKKYYVGRCKTVILSFLCKREEEILNTRQKIYYSISGSFDNSGSIYQGNLDRNLEKELDTINLLKLKNKPGKIIDVESQRKSKKPPLLLNLNELIIESNRRYGYSAEDVYDISQKLYEEHKLITYARTDSQYVTVSMVDTLIETALALTKFKGIEKIVNKELFIKRCVDDDKVTEHPAITPINYDYDVFIKKYKNLEEKAKNIYDLIVNIFINNFFGDFIYDSYKIITRIDDENFITNKISVIELGWQDRKEEIADMTFKVGDKIICKNIIVEKKLTRLPARYTDASLFKLLANPSRFVEDKEYKKILQDQGIGTDATRALLLRDLINQEYVLRKEKYLIPSSEGIELIRSIKTDNLKEPYYTAEIEKQLQKIENGEINKDVVINDVRKFIAGHITDLKEEVNKSTVFFGVCPICKKGKIVSAGEKGYGCTNLKTTGCRFYLSKNIMGTNITAEQLKKLINSMETDMLVFNGKKGKFKARIVLDGGKTKFKYS